METYISMYMKIDDETGNGTLSATVSKWNGDKLLHNGRAYEAQTTVAPIALDQSIYPYLVAALRNASDIVVSHLLEKISQGEVLLMREVEQQLISLRVAPGPAGLSRR